MEKKAINLCDKIREEELEIPQSFDLSVKHLYDLQNNVPDKYDKICLAFKFGYMQAQRAEKENKTKEENNQLPSLLSQLRPEDYRIKRQIEAILYRYLEKRDRLPDAEQYDRKKSIMRIIDSMENEERLELVERFARNLVSSGRTDNGR